MPGRMSTNWVKSCTSSITGRPPRWIDLSKLPSGLRYIVQLPTSENPGDRYQSIEKLEAALIAYRSSKDPRQNPREVLEHLVVRLNGVYPLAVPPEGELTQILEVRTARLLARTQARD